MDRARSCGMREDKNGGTGGTIFGEGKKVAFLAARAARNPFWSLSVMLTNFSLYSHNILSFYSVSIV